MSVIKNMFASLFIFINPPKAVLVYQLFVNALFSNNLAVFYVATYFITTVMVTREIFCTLHVRGKSLLSSACGLNFLPHLMFTNI